MPPVKLAVVGGGPSAFYVTSRLLSLLKPSEAPSLRVHMYDRLWAPHGLVRYGVAPDHPEVKNCTNKFDDTAKDARFRFFGNVNIGDTPLASIPHAQSLPLRSLLENYTHVLFATGCTLSTLHPAIPPSDYCIPALSMVHWYTQHPNCVPPPDLRKISHVSLIGNGNVSLDVARILLTPPSVLEKYDVPTSVLDVLRQSAVKHVSIIGRRGPFQAAFTTKELREMMNLPDASMVPLSSSVLTQPPEMMLTRQQRRTLDLLHKGSKNAYGSTPKSWSLDFYRSPIGLTPPIPSSPLAQLSLAHTELDPKTKRAVATGKTSSLSTSLVITSLGFHTDPQTAFYDPSLGHLRALSGRVISSAGAALKNVYVSGWSANGAKGVLASTMMDAYAVADVILSDITPGDDSVQTTAASSNPDMALSSEFQLNPNPNPEDPPTEIIEGVKKGTVTTYDDWKRIDEEEQRRGAAMNKERERMSWSDACAFLSRRRSALE